MANRGKRKEISFDEREWDLIQRQAADVKLDTTKYIKRMALNGYIIEYDLKVLNDFTYELNKIGVNINQITKRVNETGSIHTQEVESMQADMERIWSSIIKSLGELGGL